MSPKTPPGQADPSPAALGRQVIPSRLLAFVDESMCRVDETTMCYFMAAAVIPEEDCEEVRAALRGLLLGKGDRIHWRHEHQHRKELIAKTILTAQVESLVVVGAMMNPRKQERARQLVLKRLLFELDQRQVAHAILESRHAERDRHDMRSIGGFRDAKAVSRRLSVSHGEPVQEPMLWVADAVAGAAGDHRRGTPRCYEALGALVEQIDIGPV